MSAMKVYDSNEVALIIGAINVDSGRAKGPFVRIEPMGKAFESDVGADGEVVRWRTRDDRCKVTIILMASSSTNQAFSALLAGDKLAPNGAGIVPFSLKDGNSSTMMIKGKDFWLDGDPKSERGQEPGTVEWEGTLAEAFHNIAGY